MRTVDHGRCDEEPALIELLAPAKINVTLEIFTRRPDGYHTLRSLMLPIGLYDLVRIEAAATSSFTMTGTALPQADAGFTSDNLVTRALAACGVTMPLAVTLEKRIPIGGGLGGGSSDAAAVIEGAMTGALAATRGADWLAIARTLGSDVPFFLAQTGALVEGTGERVTAIGALPDWWCLIARPRSAVGTAEAYRRLDAARDRDATLAPSRPRAQSLSLQAVDAVQRRDFRKLAAVLSNDFHGVVLDGWPAVAEAHAAMVAAGATHALLSGSGSCLFALFEDENSARACLHGLAPAAIDFAAVVPLHHGDRWR